VFVIGAVLHPIRNTEKIKEEIDALSRFISIHPFLR
jgi:hypothetical protein